MPMPPTSGVGVWCCLRPPGMSMRLKRLAMGARTSRKPNVSTSALKGWMSVMIPAGSGGQSYWQWKPELWQKQCHSALFPRQAVEKTLESILQLDAQMQPRVAVGLLRERGGQRVVIVRSHAQEVVAEHLASEADRDVAGEPVGQVGADDVVLVLRVPEVGRLQEVGQVGVQHRVEQHAVVTVLHLDEFVAQLQRHAGGDLPVEAAAQGVLTGLGLEALHNGRRQQVDGADAGAGGGFGLRVSGPHGAGDAAADGGGMDQAHLPGLVFQILQGEAAVGAEGRELVLDGDAVIGAAEIIAAAFAEADFQAGGGPGVAAVATRLVDIPT